MANKDYHLMLVYVANSLYTGKCVCVCVTTYVFQTLFLLHCY